MTNKPCEVVAALAAWVLLATPAQAGERQILHGHVPEVVARLAPTGRLPATNRLNLVIGVPLRNREALTNLLEQLYDTASTNFHRYLTPTQFTERFGPTEADYQGVLQFLKSNGLTVDRTVADRGRVDVSATVSDIEKAFHVVLHTYQHPTLRREFYSPDVEPSVEGNVPILCISGLNNYALPTPLAHPQRKGTPAGGPDGNGHAPNGFLWGYDFRNGYAHGVTLTGSGQYVGLYEAESYYASDITKYETETGLPNVPITNVFTDGAYESGPNDNTNAVAECSLDIEMVIAMAPGLTKLFVFIGSNVDDILGSMATNSQVKQFSSSWELSEDAKALEYIQEMVAQGQSFFQGSGDGDAYTQPLFPDVDDPYVIAVGGTVLSLDSTGSNYVSETVWNSGFQKPGWGVNGDWTNSGVSGGYWGSGGGVSTRSSIPIWQQSVNMTAVGGSSSVRNVPDVALTGQNTWVNYFDGLAGPFEGTSIAAPLWAGFTALVNQQAANEGLPSVGFIAPALYAIAQSPLYASAFHDVTNGDNTWPGSPNQYRAAPGYDLCTGWGTPNGQGMIDALVGYAGPIWVNFSGGCPGNGCYTNPYCALASGTSAVATGGTICFIGPNSSSVTPTISKPMTFKAFFGPVTIGQ